jgi:hypothetical protein
MVDEPPKLNSFERHRPVFNHVVDLRNAAIFSSTSKRIGSFTES